jgi:hypothetical protein
VPGIDRAAEEGGQSLDSRGMAGDDLGGGEAAWAGLVGELRTGEHQRLFG